MSPVNNCLPEVTFRCQLPSTETQSLGQGVLMPVTALKVRDYVQLVIALAGCEESRAIHNYYVKQYSDLCVDNLLEYKCPQLGVDS